MRSEEEIRIEIRRLKAETEEDNSYCTSNYITGLYARIWALKWILKEEE